MYVLIRFERELRTSPDSQESGCPQLNVHSNFPGSSLFGTHWTLCCHVSPFFVDVCLGNNYLWSVSATGAGKYGFVACWRHSPAHFSPYSPPPEAAPAPPPLSPSKPKSPSILTSPKRVCLILRCFSPQYCSSVISVCQRNRYWHVYSATSSNTFIQCIRFECLIG